MLLGGNSFWRTDIGMWILLPEISLLLLAVIIKISSVEGDERRQMNISINWI